MNGLEKGSALLGRFLLSLIFILSGFMKISGWTQTAGYMSAEGFPMVSVMLAGTILVEMAGGLGLLVGFRARIAAGILFLFMIPTTLIFHNFWAPQGPERMDNMAHFLNNLAVMGGLLMVVALGAGALSLDARRGV
jgi:putative oxidoreductase